MCASSSPACSRSATCFRRSSSDWMAAEMTRWSYLKLLPWKHRSHTKRPRREGSETQKYMLPNEWREQNLLEKKSFGKTAKPFDGEMSRRKRLLLVSAAAVMTLATLATLVIALYLLR